MVVTCSCGWAGDPIERREVADQYAGHTLYVYEYFCRRCGEEVYFDNEENE